MVCEGRRGDSEVRHSVPELEKTIVNRELDRVVLTTNLRKHRLKRGDIGTVVLRHGSQGYAVTPRQVRRVAGDDIPHARRMRMA
jgi:hypothetical protein